MSTKLKSIKLNLITIEGKPIQLSRRARLPLTIAGLLLTVQAQAFLPTPLSLVTTGELATDANPDLMVKHSVKSVDADKQDTQNVQNSQNTNAEQLLITWRQQVKQDNLAQHITWRRLLYFIDDEKSLLGKKKNKSVVDDTSFFLSSNGQQDSAAELDAMLVALAQEVIASTSNSNNVKTNQSNSVLCRFPARVHWLTETLNIDKTALQTNCSELDDWMTMLAPEQLSMMFAQEYLDNPISAFGHTLLRIDSKASVADPSKIHHAYALNDSVDGDTSDSFLIYAIKAASGHYDNLIEIDPYPKKLADYLKTDERDTWTYQLDLTPSEVQQIMLHVWETKDLSLPYYFATDNCASEILRLIDVVRPEQHLLSQLPYAVIPSDVVNLLNAENLLASTLYTPADSSVRQAQLNKAVQAAKLGYSSYQDLTKEAANNIKSADINLASSMSTDGKTLLPLTITAANNNPLDRHALQRGQVGIGQRGDNNYVELGLRAGFHETLDRTAGFGQFFDLEGIKATLRLYDKDDNKANQPKSVVLQNFTLIRGRSYNPVNTAKKGQTWGASVEATRINDGSQEDGTDHLVASTTLEYGKSWAFGTPPANSGEMPPQLCYALATGAVQGGRGINKGYRVGAGVNAGCLYQINNQLRAQAELQLPYWYHGSSDAPEVTGHYWQPITTFGLQYDIDKKQALRLNASYDWQDRVDANDDIKLSYMRYF
ncbi:DUF4105 domain-containing protein [Psychrobacter sp.]|uniref:Lnb N-terminal periplasmic domain-containing protein n=1 Tax=Psychrobacter sp. TaxID=56811 RepID=UPI003BAEE26E